MFGQKKTSRSTSGQKKHDLGMFGLGMDFDPEAGMADDDDDNDGDFEAELAALQGHQPRKKAPRPKQKLMALSDIDKLAADCMKDVDDVSDDDEDDPALLAELEGLSPMESVASLDDTPSMVPSPASADNALTKKSSDVDVIAERKALYETAIANAEKVGEGSKARRYKRGLKEIEKMLHAAQAGKSVNMAELPPPVAAGDSKPSSAQPPAPAASAAQQLPQTTPKVPDSSAPLIDFGTPQELGNSTQQVPPKPSAKPAPEVPTKPRPPVSDQPKTTDSKQSLAIKDLTLRQSQYKLAARNSNREGDKELAKKYLLISKEFGIAIEQVKEGKEVDLSQCPPPPPGFSGGQVVKPHSASSSSTSEAEASQSPSPSLSTNVQSGSGSQATGPPPAPKTALEALEQRLEKYQSGVDDAKKEGNSSKARRMGRIVKQYQDAIRDYKAKKPVNFDELPVPPGFAPIPNDTPGPTAPRQTSAASAQQPHPQQPSAPGVPPNRVPTPNAAQKPTPKGRNQQELQFLIQRQKEFKAAALSAKKKEDLEAARRYLRVAKGIDPMIEAAKNGLRVDLTKLPPPPSLEQTLDASPTPSTDFEMVRSEDCTPDTSNREEVFASLEKSLKKQYEMCKNNMQHYSKLGDIESSKRFEKLALNCKKDFESVQSAFKHGNPPPRYHYEDRTFTIIRSNTDLGDKDCELTVVKCINIPLPSGYSTDDMKVYVNYEFPFPNDQPQTGCTETVKQSINPEFNQTFKLSIDRKNRALSRIFRRQSVKFEIKYARGFLKGDKALGQANVKLAPFDNKSDIHECVDLMDPEKGRKAVGGKIEVKLRVREPLTDKDVEILTEKWLVIDAFVMPSNRPISASSARKVEGQTGKTKSANVR